jgi:hypothetical protein
MQKLVDDIKSTCITYKAVPPGVCNEDECDAFCRATTALENTPATNREDLCMVLEFITAPHEDIPGLAEAMRGDWFNNKKSGKDDYNGADALLEWLMASMDAIRKADTKA